MRCPPIKGVAPFRSNQSIRGRQPWIEKISPPSVVASLPAGRLLGSRPIFEDRRAARPISGDNGCDWKTLVSDANGRIEDLAHRQTTVSFMQIKPPCNATGDAPSQRSKVRYLLELLLSKNFPGQAPWGSPAGVLKPDSFPVLESHTIE